MKNKTVLIVAFLILFVITSCKKKETESCGTCPVGGSTEASGFSYSRNGATAIQTDSAYYFPASKTIVAYYQGTANRVIIKTSSQAVGVYTFTSTANTLTYVEFLVNYVATGGNITITVNTGSKLSGNFTSIGGGSATTISGQFKDIPNK